MLFIVSLSNVSAASLNNRTSYSIGTDYRKNGFDFNQINTTGDAEYAYDTYNAMGWNSLLNAVPTKYNLKRKQTNGYYYLESSIIFLSGHANSGSMGWNYKGLGGDYAVDIVMDTKDYVYTDNSLGIGIGQFNNSQNDLIIFAGCNTAEGSNNLSKYVVDRGTETSIGWTTTVAAGSQTSWLKRFHDKLKTNNTTVKEAAVYANSYNYSDNRVKNYKIYGNQNLIPINKFSIARTFFKDYDILRKKQYIINEIILEKNNLSTIDNMKSNIERIISNQIDDKFNSLDY